MRMIQARRGSASPRTASQGYQSTTKAVRRHRKAGGGGRGAGGWAKYSID